MKIVFFGSSRFAVPSLKALVANGYKVSCVVTQPDRRKGRGLHLEATAVKLAAEGLSIDIYQPENVNLKQAISFLKDLEADLFVIISYGQILSADILRVPTMFSINVHASLLPKYRGAAPINWALIKGESQTGITIMQVVEKMDAGPIILQKKIKITEEDNAEILEDKLADEGSRILIDSLKGIADNNYSLIAQVEEEATFAPKLTKEDGRIKWGRAAEDLFNLIRGCVSWPGAFTYYQGKLLKIFKAKIMDSPVEPSAKEPGTVLAVLKEGIVVATGNGNIILKELQSEGRQRMSAGEFIAGHRIRADEHFE